MPSYTQCNHNRTLLIQAGSRVSTGDDHGRYRVTLCAECGLFSVFGDRNGVHFDVTFTLPTDDLVYAAGAYARWLQAAEARR